jgi:antibiotic biosynthesis monooxygenase (ABM) superfamily enzyme
VGGGFAPIFGAIFAIALATRINKPLTWWSKHIPDSIWGFLAKSWKWSLIICVSVYLFCIESTIFGWPLLAFFDAQTTNSILLIIGLGILVIMLYVALAGFANDIESRLKHLEE